MVNRIRFYTLVALMVVCMPLLRAQQPVMKQFTVENGLPSNETYHFLQDNKGYIWLGSDRGSVRYDGYGFDVFTTADGLSDNTIFDYVQAADGSLWFLTFNGQPCRLKDGAFQRFTIPEDQRKPFMKQRMWALDLIAQDTLHIYYNNRRCTFAVKDTVLHMVSQYDQRRNEQYQRSETEYGGGLASGINWAAMGLKKFRNGEIGNVMHIQGDWYLISHLNKVGLYNVVSNHFAFLKKLNESVTEMGMVEGKVYISIYGEGIFHININTGEITPEIPVELNVVAFLRDRQGVWWLSTIDQGVFKIDNKDVMRVEALKNRRMEILFARNALYATDRSTVYNATEPDRVYPVLTQCGAVNLVEVDESVYIKGKEDSLYSFSNEGLRSEKTITGSNRPKANPFIKTNSTYLYINFGYGEICYYPLEDTQMEPERHCINAGVGRVNHILPYKEDTCIVGGLHGLIAFNYRDSTLEHWNEKYSLLGNRITSMHVTGEKDVVVGTRGAGVLIKRGNKVTKIGKPEGLISDMVTTIHSENDSTFWVSTNAGLSKLTIRSYAPLDYHILSLNDNDGLSSKQVNDIQVWGDTVYVATNKGLDYFHRNLKKKTHSPPVYLNEIQVNQEVRKPSDHLELSYWENNVDIWFTGLSTRAEGWLTYRYRFLQDDTVWRYTDNRNIQLLALPPNDYRIEIYAINADGHESEEPLIVSFSIAPPYWQTWWFQLLVWLSVSLVLAGIVWYRFWQFREKERVKRRLLQSELKALRSQMNPHFTFNAMNSIQNYIRKSEKEDALNYVSKFARLLRMILDNASEDYITIQRELDALNIYLDIESRRFKEKFVYEIQVDEEVDTHYVKIPSMIIQPYVENAIWHGLMNKKEGKGLISINIKRSGADVICEVIDNGVGRKKAAELKNRKHTDQKSYGMSISEERLSLLNKEVLRKENVRIVDMEDENGNPTGTKVELILARDE